MKLKSNFILCTLLLGLNFPSLAGVITIDYGVQDIWWWNGAVESNNTELRTNDIAFSDQRIGVQFTDLLALENVQIQSAEIQLYRYSGSWQSDEDMRIDAYNITSSWDEYSSIPSYDDYAIASKTYTKVQASGWHAWDITELAQGWLQEEVDNYGVMFAGLGDNYFQRFYSSEKSGFAPKLVINTVDVSEPSVIFLLLLAGLFWLRQTNF